MRRDFEEKLRAFSQAQAQFEAEKRRALEDLRSSHRQEVEELLKNQQNQSASTSEDQEKLAELHRQEVGESGRERGWSLLEGSEELGGRGPCSDCLVCGSGSSQSPSFTPIIICPENKCSSKRVVNIFVFLLVCRWRR